MGQQSEPQKPRRIDFDQLKDMVISFYDLQQYEVAYNILEAATPDIIGEDVFAREESYIENMRGACAYGADNSDAARTHFEKAYKLNNIPVHAINLIRALTKCGNSSVMPNQRIIDICSDAINHPQATTQDRRYFYFNRGLSSTSLARASQAIEDLNQAEPCNSTFFYLGINYLRMKDYEQALSSFNKVEADFPEQAETLAFMGFCANSLGQNDLAKTYYAEALNFSAVPSKNRKIIDLELFNNALDIHQYQVALEHVDFCLKTEKSNRTYYVELLRQKAMCHRKMGDHDLAEDVLTRILPRAFQEPTRYFPVFATAATQMIESGHFDDAIALEELALAGCEHHDFLAAARSYMHKMFEAAAESGYPVLAQICKANAEQLDEAIIQGLPFPALQTLRLE